LTLYGCSTVSAIAHYTKSTDHFHQLSNEQRVFYEPGAAKFADIVAHALPSAIETVEKKQYGKFNKEIKIYACETTESYNNLTGTKAKAVTYRNSVFMSPGLMENQNDIKPYLTHELSHLMLLQNRGLYGFMTLPPWFIEGLAVFVSNGSGAGNVTLILSGKTFKPDAAGGVLDFFFRKYGSHWNLEPHLFYKQSELFVIYLKNMTAKALKSCLSQWRTGKILNHPLTNLTIFL
jgi:hypothetical protein